MGKVCRKCGYERQESDLAPDYECPQCGVVYAKIKSQDTTNGTQRTAEVKGRTQQQKQRKKRAEPVEPKFPSTTERKSLPLAIGLNFLVPGLGYLYMGKWLPGLLVAYW